MRLIKFRAWDKNKKIMYGCVDRIDWLLSGEMIRVHCCLSEIETIVLHRGYNKENNFILMQFTDLTDKNGEEIYEGDILKIEGIAPLRVGFINGCFVENNIMPPAPLGIRLMTYEKDYGKCEIIGNIYEHPEMIKNIS